MKNEVETTARFLCIIKLAISMGMTIFMIYCFIQANAWEWSFGGILGAILCTLMFYFIIFRGK